MRALTRWTNRAVRGLSGAGEWQCWLQVAGCGAGEKAEGGLRKGAVLASAVARRAGLLMRKTS